MNFNDEQQEAMDEIEERTELDDRVRNEIIEPRDVLYWLDAFGDLSLAINCQGLPKDLPDDVVEKIDEWDVLNDWQGEVNETSCPVCESTLYDFDFKHDHVFLDRWGYHEQYPEFVSDKGGYYWDASGDHYVMCERCREPPNFSRMRPEPVSGEVRVFYGEEDMFSRFSHEGTVVRWDFMWDMDYDKSTDLYNFTTRDGEELIEGYEVAADFALGHASRNETMEKLGFERIHVKEIGMSTKGIRSFWRYAHEVLKGWAKLDSETMTNEPTHPDLDFTYIIEGQYQAWVPEEHYDKFEAELVWQSLREANNYEKAEAYREKHDDLLSFGYYEVEA